MPGLQASLGIFSRELSSFSAQPSFDLQAAFLRHRDCDNHGESGRYHNDCHSDPDDCHGDPQCDPLTVSGNTVNTGRYTIAASTDGGGTLTVTDNTNGESFKVWGDPHITTDKGDTTSFQHAPATFQLPDGTEITVDPTNNSGVNFINNVTITKGNDAVTMTGFQGNLQTQALPGEGYYLDATTPDGTVLTAENGNIDQLELPDGTPISGNKIANIDSYANEGASSGQSNGQINQLAQEIVQLEQEVVQIEQQIMQIESMNMNLASPFNTGFMSDPLEDSSFG
jgi:hypothetical protein